MRSRDDFRHNFVIDVLKINLNVLCMLINGRVVSDTDNGLMITMHEH